MFVALYTTFESFDEAKAFGRLLIEKKLAACVNLFPDVHSIYRWKGEIEETTEIILWGKTQDFLIEKIKTIIQKSHPYSLPAFVVYPIHSGSEEYLNWISDETQPLHIN
ncbi:MAG: divalent-cation tolerance protein CutA [Candidatus Hodarchaeales archaeon]|jgi:periplasmic divalent cation tolerance protein